MIVKCISFCKRETEAICTLTVPDLHVGWCLSRRDSKTEEVLGSVCSPGSGRPHDYVISCCIDVMSFADINILLFQLVGKLLLKMLGIVSCSWLLINPSNPSDFLEMSREIGWGLSSPLLKVFSAGKTRHLFLCCLTSDIQGGWTVCPAPNVHKEYRVYFLFSHAEFWQ